MVLVSTVALANDFSLYSDPNGNVDNPEQLPYTSGFDFSRYTATKAFITNKRNITVQLQDTYFKIKRNAKVKIKVCYWNGNTWKSYRDKQIIVSNAAKDYSISFKVPANKPLYI